jgi:hypothetical protein
MKQTVGKEERKEMERAHAEGLHEGFPREFCPGCEAQDRKNGGPRG